jgi:predicted restriction endonuclease
MDQWFVDHYPDTSNEALARRYGRSPITIQKWARRLGLRKSAARLRERQRENAVGKRKSKATREKIRQRAIGRRMSEEAKAKALATKLANGTLRKGPTHYKWLGGKPWPRFRDPLYAGWRKAVLERDDYTCRDCGRKKGQAVGLAAHHLKSYRAHADLRCEVDNGITLCRPCHKARHRAAEHARG